MMRYQVKICISGEVNVLFREAPSWQRALHLARIFLMEVYGKGFAEIAGCDYDVKMVSKNVD